MKKHQAHERASLQSFKLTLKNHGYISLASLATWNNRFPKEKETPLSLKKTYMLHVSNPITGQ